MLRLNQEKKSRIGANWKLDVNNGDQQVKTEYFAGVKMPLKNGDPELNFDASNAFRARPLKIPRRQYGTANENVMKTLNPFFVMDRPAASFITSNNNTLCATNNTGPTCCNDTLTPDYRVAVQEPRDCLNKCNTSLNCVNNQKNALRRVRGGALLKNPLQINNGEETIVNYYTDTQSYLNNRVKMKTTPVNIANGTTATTNTNICNCSNSNSVKTTRIFKPNNSRFNVQGAVSSGTRIADLKRQTKSAYNWSEQTLGSADFCCVNNNLNTVATSRRLGGSSSAPYNEKSKTYIPILGQRILFKRSNGKKTICCRS